MHILPDKNVLTDKVKKPILVDKQVDKLEEKGISINNRDAAMKVLLSTNYYYFTGYLHNYKNFRENGEEYYDTDLSFDDVASIIRFDMQLRSILLQAVDFIERDIKTKIAYYLAIDDPNDGGINYLYTDYFTNKMTFPASTSLRRQEKSIEIFCKKHKDFIKFYEIEYNKKIENSIFVKHHAEKYWGCLPIWVAVEIMTIGNIKNLYQDVLPTKVKKDVADEYALSTELLENYMKCLNTFRNLLAHNVRLFDEKTSYTPKQNDNDTIQFTNLIFDYVFVLKHLTSDKDFWNHTIIPQLKLIFTNSLCNKISPSRWGFPSNWDNILNKM